MEVIKKQVLQALTTGITLTSNGTCRTIIPDTGATYFFKIGLVQEAQDVGFLSAAVFENVYGFGYPEIIYGMG